MTSKDGVLYSSYLDGLYFYPYAKKDKSFTVPYETLYVFINDCFYLEELHINSTPSHYFDFNILPSNTHLKKVIADGGKPFGTRYWTDGDVLFLGRKAQLPIRSLFLLHIIRKPRMIKHTACRIFRRDIITTS